MWRQTVLVPLLAIALAGFANGQGSKDKKSELVKYSVPGWADAVGEVESEHDRKVLDDFYQCKAEEDLHQAALANDAAKFGHLLADQVTWTTERFGKGIKLSKAQVLADFRSGYLKVNTHTHDHVLLVPFGDYVVVSSISTSTLSYAGKVSNGPRLSMQTWAKLDGRWQMVAHAVNDVKGKVQDHLESNQFAK